jgi:hypothetical protein
MYSLITKDSPFHTLFDPRYNSLPQELIVQLRDDAASLKMVVSPKKKVAGTLVGPRDAAQSFDTAMSAVLDLCVALQGFTASSLSKRR